VLADRLLDVLELALVVGRRHHRLVTTSAHDCPLLLKFPAGQATCSLGKTSRHRTLLDARRLHDAIRAFRATYRPASNALIAARACCFVMYVDGLAPATDGSTIAAEATPTRYLTLRLVISDHPRLRLHR